jgi:hypothetical protein
MRRAWAYLERAVMVAVLVALFPVLLVLAAAMWAGWVSRGGREVPAPYGPEGLTRD